MRRLKETTEHLLSGPCLTQARGEINLNTVKLLDFRWNSSYFKIKYSSNLKVLSCANISLEFFPTIT